MSKNKINECSHLGVIKIKIKISITNIYELKYYRNNVLQLIIYSILAVFNKKDGYRQRNVRQFLKSA